MSNTTNSLQDLLARLAIDIENMNSFLFSLNNMLESKSESVDITQTKNDGSQYVINVPSFGYLKGKIDDLNENFNTLVNTNDSVIGIKSANGDVRKFELQNISSIITDLEDVENSTFNIPTDFRIKNNWFFESFLNPLLFVSVNISAVMSSDISRFAVKRIIVNSINDDDLEYFDNNYKGINNLTLASTLTDLESNGIDYIEDDNIVDLPVGINRYKGNFDVIRILQEDVVDTTTATPTTITRRRYKLSSLAYTDILTGSVGSKFLAIGDRLITNDDSEYEITSVNVTDSEVVLSNVFGVEPITIGANILKIKPLIYVAPELQINVGFNEREIIFTKPISTKQNVTTDGYSNGFGLYTNELTISLDDESESTLENYYNNFVSDFGLILLNLAKEKTIPAILAANPDAPIVSAANFQVTQVDEHIKEAENIIELKGKIKEKEDSTSKKKELDRKITDLKAEITTKAKTQAEKQRIQKSITKKTESRKVLQDRISTLVKDITLTVSTTPQFVTESKYKVNGFWEIPASKTTAYGKQEVVQFIYRFRYLSKKGTAPNATQSEFVESNGTKKFAVFSPWTERKTKPRNKVLNEETGLYQWSTENVSDADEVNSNQLSVSIRKGEIVEIQIKSLSEAGWPDNAAESDWSDSIQVEFPTAIENQEEGVVLSRKAFVEDARIQFEDELNAKGLDLHLDSQFTTGERFFAHVATNISSGFFTTEGNVIDLYEKLKDIQVSMESLQQAISVSKGVIKISIISPDGNATEVTNGQTIDLFAGYYRDLIKDTTGGTVVYNEGRIVTSQYVMSIQNTSATPLELISLLLGGIDEVAPTSDSSANPDQDYHVNRRYDIPSYGITEITTVQMASIKQPPSNQSAQVKSQFVYSRYKDYGLSNPLYNADIVNGPSINGISGYDYSIYAFNGKLVGAETIPYNGGNYLPFQPGNTGTTEASTWNGTTDGTGLPNGVGTISEFCIHIDHPEISSLGNGWDWTNANDGVELFRPLFTFPNQQYYKFAQGLHFETSENETANVFGVNFLNQANRNTPIEVSGSNNTNRADENYPIKLGFIPNDEYLIGKYTCGAYLYPFPLNYQTISVDGNHPQLSYKEVTVGDENAINVPILFQFRCSDKLGNVGGYRNTESLTNINYSKKVGIDIYVKNSVPFSFDLKVSCGYKKVTSLDSPIIPASGLTNITF